MGDAMDIRKAYDALTWPCGNLCRLRWDRMTINIPDDYVPLVIKRARTLPRLHSRDATRGRPLSTGGGLVQAEGAARRGPG
jgi:hypothetical protein